MRRVRAGILTAVLAMAALAPVAGAQEVATPLDPPIDLAAMVDTDGVFRHLRAFQRLADRNDGHRAAGTAGYDESAAYVAGRLRALGFDVVEQELPFEYVDDQSTFAQTAPTTTTYTNNEDFLVATFSASGQAEGPLVGVDLVLPPGAADNTSTSGCEAEDFGGFPAGAIALVQRGTCPFTVKALNAEAAGAVAVVIFNEGQPGRTDLLQPVGDPPFPELPVIFTTFDVGRELAGTEGATVALTVDVLREERTTTNVIAQTRTGRTDNVVMAGAHLDSVRQGPGINDNGSGVAALLEVATRLGGSPRTNNAVRFAFWGAEELGLVGSAHYIAQLDFEAQLDIALYLNFDMVGSPNAGYFVYDGDGSDGGSAPGPFGSAPIEAALAEALGAQGVPTEGTAFDGRSDYGPFIAVGIPAGGTFTGAEGVKTPEQAAQWGGEAGVAFDPCYHRPCDTLANVSRDAIDANLHAIATVVARYAHSTREVTGIGPATLRAQQRVVSMGVASMGVASVADDGHPAGHAGHAGHADDQVAAAA